VLPVTSPSRQPLLVPRALRQVYERLIQCAFYHLLEVTLAAGAHVDNCLGNQLGDRIVPVGDAHVDQGRFISGLHDLDFIGAKRTVRNQFVNRHSDPSRKEDWEVSLSAYAKVESQIRNHDISLQMLQMRNIFAPSW